jgi:hypothetical protein
MVVRIFATAAVAVIGVGMARAGPVTAPAGGNAGPTTSAAATRPSRTDLPMLGTIPLAKVVSITVQDRFLVVTSDVNPTNGMMGVDIPELPGFVDLGVVQPNSDLPASLTFRHRDMSRPGILSQVEVIVNGGDSLQVTQGVEGPLRTDTVTLLQERNRGGEGGGAEDAVRLIVQSFNEVTGQVPLNKTLAAPDFRALCTKFPAEVDQFVRPMLRQIRMENSVFVPSESMAWQVLQPTTGPNEALKVEVLRLLGEAQQPQYVKRQAAIEQLQGLGQQGADALAALPRAGLSAQQVHVLETVIEQHRPLGSNEASKLGQDPQFLLDCLGLKDSALRGVAEKRLAKWVGGEAIAALPEGGVARDEAIAKLRALAATRPSGR